MLTFVLLIGLLILLCIIHQITPIQLPLPTKKQPSSNCFKIFWCFSMQLNENLLKNRDVWKAKILEVEARYWFLPLCVLNFSFTYGPKKSLNVDKQFGFGMSSSCYCLIGPFFYRYCICLYLQGEKGFETEG